MRSFGEMLAYMEENGVNLLEAILENEAAELECSTEHVLQGMADRLETMRRSMDDGARKEMYPKIVELDAPKMRRYRMKRDPLSGSISARASEIALSISTCNSSMGRVVAAPTAGSCGILPGVLFSWEEHRNPEGDLLSEGLTVAAFIGQIIAERATLAGAEGGCQAECGAAGAMAAGALVWMEGGSADQVFQAVALTLKSILGLVCDPVAGLVEVPCIKRNGMLVSLAFIAADMALAGIRSVIPADEVVDSLYEVGRSLPPSLRETGRGGVAATSTGKAITAKLRESAPSLEG
ncbi:L-serine ammonia-lyase, iron-sulfur-dependent, subunit alpha [Dethiosulfovibrio sp. F2B]|uniref:L-serine ammonia-lyase, iron-sulfur-dependent, subunit alpha n=1 Tax=Dethiosulfovibrio faecalis TaxID=2720018 RepID=UPI001F2BB417|nr:L-serine ammonia-lyase, iron-sulfur-dependent, subunit alpha [Dethiosulfovibrio faecalis]MCF4150985.1 L-serine ammonia-lyase, iron-sulfur-dependent, subunit alpha [Dethiosulfovibrio faecalis]